MEDNIHFPIDLLCLFVPKKDFELIQKLKAVINKEIYHEKKDDLEYVRFILFTKSYLDFLSTIERLKADVFQVNTLKGTILEESPDEQKYFLEKITAFKKISTKQYDLLEKLYADFICKQHKEHLFEAITKVNQQELEKLRQVFEKELNHEEVFSPVIAPYFKQLFHKRFNLSLPHADAFISHLINLFNYYYPDEKVE